jgi:hypothetical protein
MKLSVRHTLTFSLGTPARAVEHVLLTPLATPQQRIERWSIEMPGFAEAAILRDCYGNRAHLVSQVKPESQIVITAGGVVETIDKAGVLGRMDHDPAPAMFRRFTEQTKADAALTDGLKDGPDRIALFHELMDRVHQAETGSAQTQSQGPDEHSQSQQAAPAAQDFAHAFIGGVRALRIPARYVTGYLFDEGGASFHAWAEAWDDNLGWIGFDAMLNLCPAETHVRIASGLDATSTQPIRSAPIWGEMPIEVVEIAAE